jgi:hypothetical protein
MGYQRKNLAPDLIDKNFKFALLTDADWSSLENDLTEEILSKYTLSEGASSDIYLLSVK